MGQNWTDVVAQGNSISTSLIPIKLAVLSLYVEKNFYFSF